LYLLIITIKFATINQYIIAMSRKKITIKQISYTMMGDQQVEMLLTKDQPLASKLLKFIAEQNDLDLRNVGHVMLAIDILKMQVSYN